MENCPQTEERNTHAVTAVDQDTLLKCKRILLDFKRSNPNDYADLKTQLDILDHGYAVDLSKVSNSLLQGTLHVVFDLLVIPETNRGYFWDEESYGGRRVFDLLGDCFAEDTSQLEQTIAQTNGNSRENPAIVDENALDIDNDEEEVDSAPIGPALPPAPTLSTEMGDAVVGPILPKEIQEMIRQGIPVQIDDDDASIGPALPGQEERKPTEEAFQKVAEWEEHKAEEAKPKRLKRDEWMTMMPEAGFSSAFAEIRPRRFANVPDGCSIDPSWADSPAERKRKLTEYLAKNQIGGVIEETTLSKDEKSEKEKRVKEYLEEYDRVNRPESLASIYKRMKAEGKAGRTSDMYSRDSIFQNATRRRSHRSFAGDMSSNMGSLKSRFGDVKYSGGSML